MLKRNLGHLQQQQKKRKECTSYHTMYLLSRINQQKTAERICFSGIDQSLFWSLQCCHRFVLHPHHRRDRVVSLRSVASIRHAISHHFPPESITAIALRVPSLSYIYRVHSSPVRLHNTFQTVSSKKSIRSLDVLCRIVDMVFVRSLAPQHRSRAWP